MRHYTVTFAGQERPRYSPISPASLMYKPDHRGGRFFSAGGLQPVPAAVISPDGYYHSRVIHVFPLPGMIPELPHAGRVRSQSYIRMQQYPQCGRALARARRSDFP